MTSPWGCAKCGKPTVRADRVSSDTSVCVTVYKDPDAALFKEPVTKRLSAVVCTTCGFTELYAQDPEDLTRESRDQDGS